MPDEEVDQLLTQAELRLKVAQQFLMNEYYDDAVSRADYNMDFAATASLLARNIQGKTHRGLVARFGKEFVGKVLVEKHFGLILGSPWNSIRSKDYLISREISEEEAAVTVDDAEGS